MPPRIVVRIKKLCRATGGVGHHGLSCEGKMCRATGGDGHHGLSCDTVFGCVGIREQENWRDGSVGYRIPSGHQQDGAEAAQDGQKLRCAAC